MLSIPTLARALAFSLLIPACGDDSGHEHGGGDTDAGNGGGSASYVATDETIVSSAVERSYVLAVPEDHPATPMPLVFVLHGDGGNGAGIRSSLALEAQADGDAVFVYPNVGGSNTFEYYTYDGRTREAQFVVDVIAAVDAVHDVDPARVYLVGFSGGATMANAIGCRLGPDVIRGLGIHSGSLYATTNDADEPDFTYTGNGGVSCPLPATMFVWGEDDQQAGVSFATGEGVRDNYLATQTCDATTTAAPVTSCATYDGCERAVVWCPIDGLGHALWSGAPNAFWTFFDALR